MPISPRSRAEAAALQLIFSLPRPVRRLMAGRPIRLDGQELALDAQLLLRLQRLSTVKLTGGEPAAARERLARSHSAASGKRIEPVSIREVTIADGLLATLYTPGGLPKGSGLLVFFHGGGWVIGTRASHDNTARYLAQ